MNRTCCPSVGEHINSPSTTTVQNGVVTEDAKRVVAYNYWPQSYDYGEILSRTPESIPAEQMIHVYRLDKSGQVRGKTWLARSITELEQLDDIFSAIGPAAVYALLTRGHWTITEQALAAEARQYRAVDEDQDTDEARAANKARAELMSNISKSERNPDRSLMLIEGIDWNSHAASGVGGIGAPVENPVKMLLARAARGMGVSPYALTADFGERGVPGGPPVTQG